MKIALIGRTEGLFNTAQVLHQAGHKITTIITAKEAPEYQKTAKDFEHLAHKLNATYAYSANISNDKALIKELHNQQCDIGISVNYPNIISQQVIDTFHLGILNAHGGDLPKYRGNACQAWAILNGEKQIALCIHKMKGNELDSGDIISRDYLALTPKTKVGDCLKWMWQKAPELFLDACTKLEKDPQFILEKQSATPLRCYPLKPEDGQINWHDNAKQIIKKINAFNKPFNGAFCYYQDQKIIILEAELYQDQEQFLAIPGQVCQINADGSIIVATQTDKIKINQIEINNNITQPNKLIKSIRDRLE